MIRFALLGCGRIAKRHAELLGTGQIVGARLVAVRDVDSEKVAMLHQGLVPIYEPGLAELVQRNAAAGRLRFTTDTPTAVRHGRAQFIAFGTPPGENGSADVRNVLAAAEVVGHMDGYRVVVGKSTVPVGTGARVEPREARAAGFEYTGIGRA